MSFVSVKESEISKILDSGQHSQGVSGGSIFDKVPFGGGGGVPHFETERIKLKKSTNYKPRKPLLRQKHLDIKDIDEIVVNSLKSSLDSSVKLSDNLLKSLNLNGNNSLTGAINEINKRKRDEAGFNQQREIRNAFDVNKYEKDPTSFIIDIYRMMTTNPKFVDLLTNKYKIDMKEFNSQLSTLKNDKDNLNALTRLSRAIDSNMKKVTSNKVLENTTEENDKIRNNHIEFLSSWLVNVKHELEPNFNRMGILNGNFLSSDENIDALVKTLEKDTLSNEEKDLVLNLLNKMKRENKVSDFVFRKIVNKYGL